MTDLSPNDLSHLSDEEFNALAPQGYHATGPAEPLSPAAQVVLDAYFNHADLLNREVSHEEMLAAALRAAADQVVPACQSIDRADGSLRQGDILWDDATASICRRKLLAIAAELEQS